MLKLFVSTHLNLVALGVTVAVMNAVPVSAQQVIVIQEKIPFGVHQSPAVGGFIYGNPIPTPISVDPATGLMPRHSHFSYPQVKYRGIQPSLVKPQIRDTTIIVNPVIINNDQYRKPLRQRSRVLQVHPW